MPVANCNKVWVYTRVACPLCAKDERKQDPIIRTLYESGNGNGPEALDWLRAKQLWLCVLLRLGPPALSRSLQRHRRAKGYGTGFCWPPHTTAAEPLSSRSTTAQRLALYLWLFRCSCSCSSSLSPSSSSSANRPFSSHAVQHEEFRAASNLSFVAVINRETPGSRTFVKSAPGGVARSGAGIESWGQKHTRITNRSTSAASLRSHAHHGHQLVAVAVRLARRHARTATATATTIAVDAITQQSRTSSNAIAHPF